MSFHCWDLQTRDKTLCQAGLYPLFLDTLVNPHKCTSRPEETEKEHADCYKGPGNLLVIKVDSVCFIVMFYNLHWCHMIFVYQISHAHTMLWCWQGLLFLIHRTEKPAAPAPKLFYLGNLPSASHQILCNVHPAPSLPAPQPQTYQVTLTVSFELSGLQVLVQATTQ